MPEPLVSIIIRSMGRDCLANAVASVAQQTHRPLELVVVDATGGSHPPLPHLPTLTRARLVNVGRRLLRPAAANVGINHADGEWIGFLDDDDFFEPTHVARLLARAAEPDRPRLVHCQQIAAMSCILHRSLVDTGIRLDETLETNEDWDLWLRLMPHTHFATVREPTRRWCARATRGSATRRGPFISVASAKASRCSARGKLGEALAFYAQGDARLPR